MTRRDAEAPDVPPILAMLRAFHAASRQPFAFDAPYLSVLTRRLIASPDGLARLLVVDGMAVGMILAQAGAHLWSPCRQAYEFALWVGPEHRGGAGALGLVRDYEAWARARGCRYAALSWADDFGVARVGRAYLAMGYGRPEITLVKDLG